MSLTTEVKVDVVAVLGHIDLPPGMLTAVIDALSEVGFALAKHPTRNITTGSPDRALRIMTEEVGEVARAIDDIEAAEVKLSERAPTCSTKELEDLRVDVQLAKEHLRTEIAQVAACSLLWLSTLAPHKASTP